MIFNMVSPFDFFKWGVLLSGFEPDNQPELEAAQKKYINRLRIPVGSTPKGIIHWHSPKKSRKNKKSRDPNLLSLGLMCPINKKRTEAQQVEA
jgi:hypothetical protein